MSVAEGEALSERLQKPLEKSLEELDKLLASKYSNWKDMCTAGC